MSTPDAPDDAESPATSTEPKTATLPQVASAVFWSFFGVRKRANYESDSQTLKPQHVIAAGLVSAVILVLVLFGIVKLVTR